ncbi:LysM peptidoglycan-binding domain-containing protein [Micromonospora sp. NPDC049523]|uniref:LysM peptidoglycan-binding domain-containing protein n=1 Tax=Micromonospora sp. NPDC049523 TaxID=3155921 RepID=UPI0034208CF8
MGAPDISRPSQGGRLRLTRRGRVVLVGLFLILAAGLAVALAPSSRASDPPGPAPTAVVLPGDTLWSVAERHRPSRQPFRVIAEIRRLNGLDDYTIHAGQRLKLPREE